MSNKAIRRAEKLEALRIGEIIRTVAVLEYIRTHPEHVNEYVDAYTEAYEGFKRMGMSPSEAEQRAAGIVGEFC